MVADDAYTPLGQPMTARRMAATAVRRLTAWVLPQQCLACHTPVAEPGGLCAGCWSRLTLIGPPICPQLGIPLPYDLGPDGLSAEAIADPPPFHACRAVAVFDDVAQRLVHGLKYRDQLELARWMGRWMVRAGADVLSADAVLVPIPLHRRRLWQRRYNQAGLLAQAIAGETGLTFDPASLQRVRPTRQQVGLTLGDRERNVRGAFAVPAARRTDLAGRRVVLIDDVYTTGATLRAATRTLRQAGASRVDVLVFARVVRGEG